MLTRIARKWMPLLVAVLMAVVTSGCAATYTETEQSPQGGQVAVNASLDAGDYSVFYDGLAPYGEWFDYPGRGRVWTPYDMPSGWRPYSDGRWAYTDAGWTWVENEPWGWGPYHYGRWFFDSEYGWCWMPGHTWAPAWVSWREDDDHVGWAPLPPDAQWDASAGLQFGSGAEIDVHAWSFVPREHLADEHVRDYVEPPARNVTFVGETQEHHEYTADHDRPFDRGVDVTAIERAQGHAVARIKLADRPRPMPARGQGGSLGVFRPELRPSEMKQQAIRPQPAAPAIDEDALAKERADQERQMQAMQDQQRKQLEAVHQRELAQPKPGMPLEQIQARHDAEKKALEEQFQRERQVHDKRMQRGFRKPPAQPLKGRRMEPDKKDNGGH